MKQIKMMLALLAALVCGGAWATDIEITNVGKITPTGASVADNQGAYPIAGLRIAADNDLGIANGDILRIKKIAIATQTGQSQTASHHLQLAGVDSAEKVTNDSSMAINNEVVATYVFNDPVYVVVGPTTEMRALNESGTDHGTFRCRVYDHQSTAQVNSRRAIVTSNYYAGTNWGAMYRIVAEKVPGQEVGSLNAYLTTSNQTLIQNATLADIADGWIVGKINGGWISNDFKDLPVAPFNVTTEKEGDTITKVKLQFQLQEGKSLVKGVLAECTQDGANVVIKASNAKVDETNDGKKYGTDAESWSNGTLATAASGGNSNGYGIHELKFYKRFFAAQVGETKYGTLAEALTFAEGNATESDPVTVTLLANATEAIEIPENVIVTATPTAKITGAISGSGTYSIANGGANQSSYGTAWFSASQLVDFSGTVLMTKGRFELRTDEVSVVPRNVTLATSNQGKIYLASGEWNNKFVLAGSGWTGDSGYKMGPVALRIDSGSFGEDATIEVVVEDNVVPSIGVYNTSPTLCAISGTGGLRLRADSARTITISGAKMNGLSGEINLFDANVTLAVDVASDETATVGNVISGSGKLKKTGAGTLQLTNKNSFTGGMTIDAGTVKGGATDNWDNNGAGPFGKNTGTITIGANGTLDFYDNPVKEGYAIVSNGGTIKKTGTSGNATYQYIKSLTLNANTTLTANTVLGVGVANTTTTTLALGAYSLNVSIDLNSDGRTHNFFLRNTQVTGTGTINLMEGNLLLYGAGSTASEATITLAREASIEAQQNLTVKNLNWDGGNISVSSGKSVSVTGQLTANIGSDKNLPVVLTDTATSITKGGSGTLTIAADKLSNFAGSITVNAGAVDLGRTRPIPSMTFGENTIIKLSSTLSDDGKIVIPVASGNPTVYLDGVEKDVAPIEGKITIDKVPIKVSGDACAYDWTFSSSTENTSSKAIAAVYPTSNANLTGDINASYTRQVEETYTALKTKVRPWRNHQLTAPFSVAVAGCMPTENNTVFVSFGSSVNNIFIAAGSEDDTIEIVRAQGSDGTTNYKFNKNNIQQTKSQRVSNRSNAQHTVVFTTVDGRSFDLYMDGKYWTTMSFDSVQNLGSGLQVGGWYGGSASDECYHQANDTTAPDSYVSAIRVYNTALGPNAVKTFADEFPYVSPSGKSVRTLTAAAETWEQANAWQNTPYNGATVAANAPIDGSEIELTTTAGINTVLTVGELSTNKNFESVTIKGNGSVKFTCEAQNPEFKITATEAKIEGNLTISKGIFDLANGSTTIGDGGCVTFDFSTLPEAGVAAKYPFSELVTGSMKDPVEIEGEDAKLKLISPENRIVLSLVYNAEKCYEVQGIVPAGTIYAKDFSFASFRLEDGTDTCLFPNDAVVIPADCPTGANNDEQWMCDVTPLLGHHVTINHNMNWKKDLTNVEIGSGVTVHLYDYAVIPASANISGEGSINVHDNLEIGSGASIAGAIYCNDGNVVLTVNPMVTVGAIGTGDKVIVKGSEGAETTFITASTIVYDGENPLFPSILHLLDDGVESVGVFDAEVSQDESEVYLKSTRASAYVVIEGEEIAFGTVDELLTIDAAVYLTFTAGNNPAAWTDLAGRSVKATTDTNGVTAFTIVADSPKNGMTSYESYVLGLDSTNASSKSVISAEQGTAADSIKIVDNITPRSGSGRTVTRKLKIGATADDCEEVEATYNDGFTIPLPTGDDKVKFIKIEYVIQ